MRKNDHSFVPFGTRKLLLGVLATGAFLVAYTQLDSPRQAAAAPAAKVQVCHVPPGNPDNFHTITISANALPAHLAHGDLDGLCNALCATLCDDEDACTIDDAENCEEEGCPTDRMPVDCDDGIECTKDECDPQQGCMNPADIGKQCDDGAFCTKNDACRADSTCGGDEEPGCCENDLACGAEYCNGNFCDMDHVCDSTGFPCDDGIFCTADMCTNGPPGACENVATDSLCDDGIVCTVDSCDSEADCQNMADDGECDDGVACTVDVCDSEADCQNMADDGECDDGVACTVDVCDPNDDCQFTADDNSCDDGEACTIDKCDPDSPALDGCRNDGIPNCCSTDGDCPAGQVCDGGNCQAPELCFDAVDCFGSGLQCLIDACEAAADCPDSGRRPFNHFGAIMELAGSDCANGHDLASCWVVNQGLIDRGCLNVCGETGPPPPGSALCECLDVLGNPGVTICVPMLNSCPPPNFDVQCQNSCANNGFSNSRTQCLDQGCPPNI